MNTMTFTKRTVTTKALITTIAVFAAIALPQIFHVIGTLSGTGSAVGTAFLPMHIPVLLAGFLGGPVVGLIAGILSPIISFGISGMPGAVVLPFIIAELAAYGLAAGLLSKVKMTSFTKLLIVQVAGRVVRAAAILLAIYAFGNTKLTAAAIPAFVMDGLFGIVLQWAFVPLFIDRIEGMKKRRDA